MPKSRWIVLLLCFIAGVAAAQGPTAALKLVEHSMVVTGHVLIEPDGSVSGWEIDQADRLPPAVVALIERSAPVWRFEPVLIDGQPQRAKGRMSLRLTANPLDDGQYRIALRSGHFGKDAMDARERLAAEGTDAVQVLTRKSPIYPMAAARGSVRGTVYLVLRIGRDGRVEEAVAEQVNLRTAGTPNQMRMMRNMLAGSALRAIREWTFQPPTTGELAGRDSWSGRIAVDYTLNGERAPEYGQWHAYIPGPRERAPWLPQTDLAEGESPDTLLAGGFRPVGQDLKLLTPLQGG